MPQVMFIVQAWIIVLKAEVKIETQKYYNILKFVINTRILCIILIELFSEVRKSNFI